jgi:hypothetical protein
MGAKKEVPMDLTRHARTRMQQRGINAAALDALLAYGRVAPAGDGCEVVYFDKRTRQRLERATAVTRGRATAATPARGTAATPARGTAVAPAKAGVHRICNTYAIVASDGSVITVGHRTRRIPR